MITSVQVDSLDLTLSPLTFAFGDESANYIIKKIDGLGPVSADLKFTGYSDMPGAAFQSARVNTRNPLITIGLNSDYSGSDPIGTLRRGLYRHLGPSRNVKLTFARDVGSTVTTTGIVESLAPDIFSDEPQVVISIMCPDPYFYDVTTWSQTFLGSNGYPSFVTTNPGDVNSGMKVLVDNLNTGGAWVLIMGRYYNGDSSTNQPAKYTSPNFGRVVLKLDTTKGSKSLAYMNYYEYHNIDPVSGNPPYTGQKNGWINGLGYLDNWLEILPGQNNVGFAVWLDTGGGNFNPNIQIAQPDVTLSYTPKYAGL